MISRDQERALHAYKRVAETAQTAKTFENYGRIVDDFGICVKRLGLSAALADVQRRGGPAAEAFFDHVATHGLPKLLGATGTTLLRAIRELDMFDYLLVSKETLKLASWLKRAVQAYRGHLPAKSGVAS